MSDVVGICHQTLLCGVAAGTKSGEREAGTEKEKQREKQTESGWGSTKKPGASYCQRHGELIHGNISATPLWAGEDRASRHRETESKKICVEVRRMKIAMCPCQREWIETVASLIHHAVSLTGMRMDAGMQEIEKLMVA